MLEGSIVLIAKPSVVIICEYGTGIGLELPIGVAEVKDITVVGVCEIARCVRGACEGSTELYWIN